MLIRILTYISTKVSSFAVIWLKYCRCGVKHYPINQSIWTSKGVNSAKSKNPAKETRNMHKSRTFSKLLLFTWISREIQSFILIISSLEIFSLWRLENSKRYERMIRWIHGTRNSMCPLNCGHVHNTWNHVKRTYNDKQTS